MDLEIIMDEEVRLANDGTNVTPRSQKRKKEFPFYCPICTFYFKNIQKLKCCENSICEFCVKDIIRKNESEDEREEEEGEEVIEASPTCPFCNSIHLDVEDVDNSEDVRIYFPPKIDKDEANKVVVEKKSISPVRPGDSYDDLKRKMVLREIDGYFRVEKPPPTLQLQKKKKVKKKKKKNSNLKNIFGDLFSFYSCCSADISMVVEPT